MVDLNKKNLGPDVIFSYLFWVRSGYLGLQVPHGVRAPAEAENREKKHIKGAQRAM